MAKKQIEIQYPLWKSVAWRFLRAGVASGITSLLTVQVVLHPDLSNFKVYGYALVAGFGAGFISGAGLAIREYFGDNNRSAGVVNKLPV